MQPAEMVDFTRPNRGFCQQGILQLSQRWSPCEALWAVTNWVGVPWKWGLISQISGYCFFRGNMMLWPMGFWGSLLVSDSLFLLGWWVWHHRNHLWKGFSPWGILKKKAAEQLLIGQFTQLRVEYLQLYTGNHIPSGNQRWQQKNRHLYIVFHEIPDLVPGPSMPCLIADPVPQKFRLTWQFFGWLLFKAVGAAGNESDHLGGSGGALSLFWGQCGQSLWGFWICVHWLKMLQPRGTVPYSTVFFLVRLGAIVHILLWQEVDELVSQIAERPGHGIPWFMSLLVNVYVILCHCRKWTKTLVLPT